MRGLNTAPDRTWDEVDLFSAVDWKLLPGVCADPTLAAAMCLPSQARRKCDRIKRCSLLCAHVVIRSMTGIEKCAMSQDELAALLQQRGRKRKLKNSVVLQVCAQPSCMLSLCRLTMWPDRTEAACA